MDNTHTHTGTLWHEVSMFRGSLSQSTRSREQMARWGAFWPCPKCPQDAWHLVVVETVC